MRMLTWNLSALSPPHRALRDRAQAWLTESSSEKDLNPNAILLAFAVRCHDANNLNLIDVSPGNETSMQIKTTRRFITALIKKCWAY